MSQFTGIIIMLKRQINECSFLVLYMTYFRSMNLD